MESGSLTVQMDPGSLSRQVEGVERSVVFLRQEHLTLLHGLHLEILSLEKRCTELTCEVNVKPPGRTQFELLEEEELLEARCLEAESLLAERQCTLGELRKELSHKGTLVGALRANLKDKERRFLEELKRRSHRSTVLNTELHKQTEAAAYLSFQLHAARQKLQHQRLQQRQDLLRANWAQYATERGDAVVAVATPRSPSSPASAAVAGSPVVKPKRRSVRPSSGSHHHQHLRAERARECVPREVVTGPAEPIAMPDPALFLHPRMHRTTQGRQNRQSPSRRQAPLDQEREEEEEERRGVVGERSQDGVPRLAATTAPPAAETKAE